MGLDRNPGNTFKLGYARPIRLSDPHNDFDEDETRAMLAKSDVDLDWSDFRNILGPHLPAGTYEESVYFLPLAFEYIASHDDDALDLITSIVWFMSEYSHRLEADGLMVAARERVGRCFRDWTRGFEVLHFDDAACREKGWRLTYYDYVKYMETICEGTCDLVRFVRHSDMANDFFRSLADHGTDAIKAAWFLEMSRAQTDIWHPPVHVAIRKLLSDESTIRSATALVKSSGLVERSPSYWGDAFAVFGVT